MKPRRDEIGDLVRDFNFMAGRIEALVTSQRQLLSDISHELRSPLARVNATLGVARQRLGQNTLVDRIERDTGRLNDMIGRLLTVARLEMTTTPPEMRRTDLRVLLSEIVADAQLEARERNCRVDLVGSDSCDAQANADLLRSAVENIVRNAIRYTAPGTAVDVCLDCGQNDNGAVAIVSVSDRGPGVPATELANIFRPFYRVADARDRESGGVGLGLAIAERVARAHGGSVAAENRAGGGLEVVLTVKAISDPPEPSRASCERS
jgi:two-component system sensor histidine kinase CpxA